MFPSKIIRDRWGYLQAPELEALKQCIDTLPFGSTCVNIGAGFGTSGLAFIESKNVDALFTVDKFRFEKDNGLGSLEVEERVFKEFGFDKDYRYHSICGDSAEVGKVWQYFHCDILKIDMIFIDGDHSYEQCKADILAWLPNMKKGGIMSFHDYGPEDGLQGVSTAVDEILVNKYEKIAHAKAFAAFRITDDTHT